MKRFLGLWIQNFSINQSLNLSVKNCIVEHIKERKMACFSTRLTLFHSRVHRTGNKPDTEKPLKTALLDASRSNLPKKESVNYFWVAVKCVEHGAIFLRMCRMCRRTRTFRTGTCDNSRDIVGRCDNNGVVGTRDDRIS